MAPTGGDFRSPPSLRPRGRFPLLVATHRLLGVLFTLVCIVLFVAIIPFLLILRCIGYVKRKSRRWRFEKRICTSHAAVSGSTANVGIIFTDAHLTKTQVDQLVERPLANFGPSWDDSARFRSSGCNETDRPLSNEQHLLGLLNDPLSFDSSLTSISICHGFQTTSKKKSNCLVLVSNSSHSSNMCIQRLLCILSNHRFHLEMEPRFAIRFPADAPQINFVHNTIVVLLRVFAEAPSIILSFFLRSNNPVWKYLEGGERKTSRIRRGVRILEQRDSSSVLMESVPEDVVVMVKDGAPHRHRTSSLLREVPLTHRRCWLTVPNGELMGRAERLLRASSGELMLTLVAGTLRAYCRQQGVLHPPDVGVVMPVSCRNYQAVNSTDLCRTQLFPVLLPTGVEGVIPRLWCVQKRLYQGMGGPLPYTLGGTQKLVRACLPAVAAAAFLRSLYSTHAVYFAYYRVSNDVDTNSPGGVQSLLYFPSLSDTIKASFVFLQNGRETRVCVSLCKRTFPDADAVLRTFENECHLLLDHLSSRLMSLPQSTILPGLLPSSRKREEDPEMFGSTYLRQQTSDMETSSEQPDETEYSLEELHRLLATVQSELDGMRANPEGDRAEYIRKLGELEDRMQRFHQCITSRLGTEGEMESEKGELMENIFAPYKDGPGSSHQRRFSREFSRTEEQVTRKSSRTSM